MFKSGLNREKSIQFGITFILFTSNPALNNKFSFPMYETVMNSSTQVYKQESTLFIFTQANKANNTIKKQKRPYSHYSATTIINALQPYSKN